MFVFGDNPLWRNEMWCGIFIQARNHVPDNYKQNGVICINISDSMVNWLSRKKFFKTGLVQDTDEIKSGRQWERHQAKKEAEQRTKYDHVFPRHPWLSVNGDPRATSLLILGCSLGTQSTLDQQTVDSWSTDSYASTGNKLTQSADHQLRRPRSVNKVSTNVSMEHRLRVLINTQLRMPLV